MQCANAVYVASTESAPLALLSQTDLGQRQSDNQDHQDGSEKNHAEKVYARIETAITM